MGYLVDIALRGNQSASSVDNGSNSGEKEEKKKVRMVSQIEGEFYCTYSVDEKGKMTLISKIRLTTKQSKDSLADDCAKKPKKPEDCYRPATAYSEFQKKQVAELEAATRKNTVEVISFLESGMGIVKPKKNQYNSSI